MKELEFLEVINEIDPELLEDRRITGRNSRTNTVRRALLAAAAVLLLGGTVFAVARGIVRMNRVSSSCEDGVEAAAELTRIPWSSFRGEIQSAGEIIARQYAEYEPQPVWSGSFADPGEYTRQFADVDEAVAYIGLAELKTPAFPYTHTICFRRFLTNRSSCRRTFRNGFPRSSARCFPRGRGIESYCKTDMKKGERWKASARSTASAGSESGSF